jgi:hypothetical protein
MAVPILNLNLAPRPNLWRQHHVVLGWVALGAGLTMLLGTLGLTWRAYHQASRAGREAVNLTEETRRASVKEQQIQASLQEMDASREQSRWKLAERILMERALPWSRLTAELEQCMVPDMRLKAIQRTRNSGQQVVMKLKGEAKTREAETAFVELLQATPVFTQVVLEREAERPGGGWEFELNLPTATVPPPFRLRTIKPRPAAIKLNSAIPTLKAPPIRNQPSQPMPAPSAPPILKQAPPPVIELQPSAGPPRTPPVRSTPTPRRGLRRRPNIDDRGEP